MPLKHKYYNINSNFVGPFPLTAEEIDKARYNQYGCYLLGYSTAASYKIRYVGRGHLKTRLRTRLKERKYEVFYYKVANVKFTRFRIECSEFHRYGKANLLDNKIHPAKIAGNYPRCTEIGCNGEAY